MEYSKLSSMKISFQVQASERAAHESSKVTRLKSAEAAGIS